MKVIFKTKPTLLEVADDMAQGLYKAGVVDAVTLRELKELSLPPVKAFSPQQIKRIRLKQKVSQAVFARYLNISTSTVRQWEQGEKHPGGTSLKLLNLVAEKGLVLLI